MIEATLLFDHDHAFFGEIETHGGTFRHAMLSEAGERRLESHLREWQVRGVPVLREVVRSNVSGHPVVFFQERVQVRTQGFLQAARQWFESHGIAAITVDRDVLRCWSHIARLPLDPRERFLLLISLRGSRRADLLACEKTLLEAVEAADVGREKMTKAIGKLWDRAAKELVAKFAA
ncbi:hypothetical protein KJ781_00040 [Patescibacteria group bacterium]|nr:hypothetical protein [Patescibacteria group bacterium]MBU1448390.1 hypothetical protein [Patescibacteria group bacterium]MBU2613238.1 hypothetical protein [Patescibacteria group bacterium]